MLLVSSFVLFPFSVTITKVEPAFANTQPEEQQIRQVVVTTLTNSGQPADANPRAIHVVIVSNYALADWILGKAGGEILLVRQKNIWQPVTLTGGVMDTSSLIEQGVPESIAVHLLQKLQAQWKH